MRFFARRLLIFLLLVVPVAGAVMWWAWQHRPASHVDGRHRHGHRAKASPDAFTRFGHTVGHVAHTAAAVASGLALGLAALAVLTTLGHLVGRYLRRHGQSRLPAPLGTWADTRRALMTPRTVELVLGREDHAMPHEVAKLFDGLAGVLRPRWWTRTLLGPDPISLKLVNEPENRILRFTLAVRRDALPAVRGRLKAIYPDARLRPVDLAGDSDAEVLRLKKARRWLWALHTTREYEHSTVESLLATMSDTGLPTTVELLLTPTPAVLERFSAWAIRRQEKHLRTETAHSPTSPGVDSYVAQQTIKGAVEGVGKALFWFDFRIVVPVGRREAARHLAGIVQEARAENELRPRVMRLRRPLYARRVIASIPPFLPALRTGALSSAEISTIWHLPSLRLKGVGLQRAGAREIVASPAISRDPSDTLLIDEHGSVGIAKPERRYGWALIGAAGSGKTAALMRHIANVARDPERALIVIDPKEDLARECLCAIPETRKVNILDLGHPLVGLNPLTALRSSDAAPEVVADLVISAIKETTTEGSIGSRSDEFLRAAITAVCTAEQEPTLHHVRKMLDPFDAAYRDWVVRELGLQPESHFLIEYWGTEFQAMVSANPKFFAEAVHAPRNKLSRFLAVPSLAYLTNHKFNLDLQGIIDRREILIVNGAKGAVGEENAVLLCQLLVLLIQKLLHQQQRRPRSERVQTALIMDEAHNVFTPAFATMLSEGRSGGLEAVCAFQYSEQIVDDRVKAGVKSLLQNISIFRLREFEDARAAAALAMEVFADNIRGEVEDQRRLRIDPMDIVNLPTWRCVNLWLADGARPQPAFTAQTIPIEPLLATPAAEQAAAWHLQRQTYVGYHPHDHGEHFEPAHAWTKDTPVIATGRTVRVDLTGWEKPVPFDAIDEVTFQLRPTGTKAWHGYLGHPSDKSGRRYETEIPASPDELGWLPKGSYEINVCAHIGERRIEWIPSSKIKQGDTTFYEAVPIHLPTAPKSSPSTNGHEVQ